MKKIFLSLLLSITSLAVCLVDTKTKLPPGTESVIDTGVVGPKRTSDVSGLMMITTPSFTISDSMTSAYKPRSYAVSILNQPTGVMGTINLAQLGKYRLALVPGGSSFTAPGSVISVINPSVTLTPGFYSVDKKTGYFVANPSEVTQYSLAKFGKNTIVLTKDNDAAITEGPGIVLSSAKTTQPVTSQLKIGGGAVSSRILKQKIGGVY